MTETEYDPDDIAAWHIMRLMEQTRTEFIIAQILASIYVSSEMNGPEIKKFEQQISEFTVQLLLDPSDIWDALLPGGTGLPDFRIVPVEKGENMEDWDQTENWYLINIYRNPRMSWDDDGEEFNPVAEQRAKPDESVLNLAGTVRDRLNYVAETTRVPVDELAAHITEPTNGGMWLMTIEQAEGILALEAADKKLNYMTDAFNFETDYQTIQDEMANAGQDFGRELENHRAS